MDYRLSVSLSVLCLWQASWKYLLQLFLMHFPIYGASVPEKT